MSRLPLAALLRALVLIGALTGLSCWTGRLWERRVAQESPGGPAWSLDATVHLLAAGTIAPGVREDSLRIVALRGALAALQDPYARLMEGAEDHRFQILNGEEFGGIGVFVRDLPTGLLIQGLVPQGPAAQAGLAVNDLLVAADDTALSRATGTDRLLGPPGSRVRLTVRRAGVSRTVTVVRAILALPSIAGAHLLTPTTGYVSLTGFGPHAAAELSDAMTQLTVAGMTHLVLDLRDNPGGSVEESARVAGLFLPPGAIVARLHARVAEPVARDTVTLFRASPPREGAFPTLPVVVLVGAETASAAEILAAALQEADRATLVGERTYGKGSAQTIWPFFPGLSLKFTTARWTSPLGRQFDRHLAPTASDSVVRTPSGRRLRAGAGLTPDRVVAPPRDTTGHDLARALGNQLDDLDDRLATCWAAHALRTLDACADARPPHLTDARWVLIAAWWHVETDRWRTMMRDGTEAARTQRLATDPVVRAALTMTAAGAAPAARSR